MASITRGDLVRNQETGKLIAHRVERVTERSGAVTFCEKFISAQFFAPTEGCEICERCQVGYNRPGV